MKARLWQVTIANDGIFLGLVEASREDYIKEQKKDGNDIVSVTYLVKSSSSGTAVKKAINEFRKDRLEGRDVKFGYVLYASVEKVINRRGVMEAWQGKVLR